MSRITDYIGNNSTSKIRSRAKEIFVGKIIFSEDEESANTLVKGSQGDFYEIIYYGLKTGFVTTSCTCPYNWGGICKHEIAVGVEIDSLIRNNKITSALVPVKEYSKNDPIIIPFAGEFTLGLLRSYCKNNRPIIYRYYGNPFSLISKSEDTLVFSFKEHNETYSVSIKKINDSISIFCNCSETNKYLCTHQTHIFADLINDFPKPFISPKEIKEIKENLLQEYGFTLKNKQYRKYFFFELEGYQYVLKHLVTGLTKIGETKDLDIFNENIFDKTLIQQIELPEQIIQKPKKKKGVAVVISFFDEKEYSLPQVFPIIGNLNKAETEISSKIQEITSFDFLEYKRKLNKNDFQMVEAALDISEDLFDRNDEEVEKYFIKHLKILIDIVGSRLVYKTDEESHRLVKRNLHTIKLSNQSTDLSFKVIEEDLFFTLKSYVHIEDEKHDLSKIDIGNIYLFAEHKNTYYLNKSVYHSKILKLFKAKPEIRVRKNEFDEFYNNFIKPLSGKYKIDLKILDIQTKKIEEDDLKRQIYISEQDGYIILRPVMEYNEQHIELLSFEVFEKTDKKQHIQFERNEELEKAFLEMLKTLHPTFPEMDQSFFYLSKDDFVKDLWFINAMDKLNKAGIEVFGLDKLTDFKYNTNKPSLSVSINSGIDWFDVNMQIKFGKEIISLKEVRKSIINKSKYVQLKDGTIGVLPEEWINKYAHLFRSGEVKKDHIEVSKYQFSVIESLYEDLDHNLDWVKNHLSMQDKLQSFTEITKVRKPKGVKATLRDYQKEGLNWLNFLDEFGFGGCLADDMGLGKTLQILSFLQLLKNRKKKAKPHLIVVPTSLIFNWQDEVNKFCPGLNIFPHVGSDRLKNTKNFKKYDIILSTYGIVANDIEYLKDYTFEYVILDESQAIKNPNSKRFKALRLLQANNKLVMTGTPIENNTFDLYAQLTFVNPGLLGNMAHFKKQYSTPIDKNKDAQVAKELSNLIKPFILRRTKEQVATELPPKTEQILYCAMEKEQQKLYDAYRNKYRDYLLKKISDDGLGKSKMYVLEGLTKLRQICDSPQLLNDEESYTDESIKIKELIRHVTEKTGNHKILIFSQFVKMLGLIKTKLDEENIQYEYLDGRTRDRQARVENFQNNEEVRVFLISLKAGGTGLNLTAADYVYLVDPWWNPAVEAQAIDRCYRIGQDKAVMAYKMICKGTIEEKIIGHQLNKKQLSSDIIQTDESFVKSLSKESIEDLFS